MKKIILLIICLSVLAGCSDLTSDRKYNQEFYVITGFLKAGEHVSKEKSIFIGKTLSVDGGNINDLYIDNADVTVYNHTQNDSIQLAFFAEFDPEDPQGINFGYFDPDSTVIVPENEYEIVARITEGSEIKEVKATTTVPKDILINPDNDPVFAFEQTDDLPDLDYDNANIDHPLVVETFDPEPVNLKLRFYCLETYDNAQYIFPFVDQEYPEDEEEYEGNGNEYPRNLWYIADYLPAAVGDRFLITDQGYKSNFIFYGDYAITIQSIDTNYYKYLYKLNGYLHGGIQNGYGYFGSVNGNTIYTEVVE